MVNFFLASLFLHSAFTTADSIAKIRFNTASLDRLLCATLAPALDKIMRGAVLSWVPVSDDSMSNVKIILPTGEGKCNYQLLPNDNSIRLSIDWPLMGQSDMEIKANADVVWKNGTFSCTSDATLNPAQITFDGDQFAKDVCNAIEKYLSQFFTKSSAPIWAGLNLEYLPEAIRIYSDAVELDYSTSIDSSDHELKSNPLFALTSDNTIQIGFDQRLINTILKNIYDSFGKGPFIFDSENSDDMKKDCGLSRAPVPPPTCLGSFVQSALSPKRNFDSICEIKLSSEPRIKFENDFMILRANGFVRVSVIENSSPSSNFTLVKGNFRLIARFIANITDNFTIVGSTSTNDIALMLSEFGMSADTTGRENFSVKIQEILHQLAAIMINLINEQFSKGLPTPFQSKNVKLIGSKFFTTDTTFGFKSDVNYI